METSPSNFNFFAKKRFQETNSLDAPRFGLFKNIKGPEVPQNQQTSPSIKEKSPSFGERLNAYDSEILEEKAISPASTAQVKRDFAVKRIEKEIKEVEKQIADARFFADNAKIQELHDKKAALLAQIEVIEKSKSQHKASFNLINIFKRLFGFKESARIDAAMVELYGIQSDIDDILYKETPYGERDLRYNALADRILRAGKVNAELNKTQNS